MRAMAISADKIRAAAATTVVASLASLALGSSAASAASLPPSHGQLLQLAPFRATANPSQSSNWLGYDQGTLEQGGKLFNAVTGEWTVPKATLHAAGQEASSSDWIGVGGGCIDAGCTLTDQTLIQTGTEQDVASNGSATYSAWWEEIPSPSVTIASVSVSPGDRMYASLAETIADSNIWTITLKDLTNGQSFTATVPYASTHASAEWIEENPLVVGATGSGFATLPNLTSPAFDKATVDGAPVKLTTSEQMQLIDSNGNVIGASSAPDPEADGFNACAWAATCAAPGAGFPAAPSNTTTGPSSTTVHAGTGHRTTKRHTSTKPNRRRHTSKRPAHRVARKPRRR